MGRSRTPPPTSCRRTAAWWLAGGLFGAATIAPARAHGDPLCDHEWRSRPLVVEVGERKADDTPLKAFDPARQMAPYELPGDRYLFGHKNAVHKVIGDYPDRAAGKAALEDVELHYPQ